MKNAKQKGSTASRLSLILKNQSLLMMQFTSDENMPSEEQIQIDIKAQLIKTNEAFRQFVESCRNAQSIVVETEDGIQQEL